MRKAESRERRAKSTRKTEFFMTSFLLIVFLFSSPALAWGSITHSAICRAAGEGDDFALGGVAPDMIALHSVTTVDKSYDYAHNLYGAVPVFGSVMAKQSGSGFAAGWRAHQTADAVVHGRDGYSNTKRLSRILPAGVSTDINHGLVELIVDTIVLSEFYGGHCSLEVPDHELLIHETAVEFFNSGHRGGPAIDRSAIITCHDAAALNQKWNMCLATNICLAELLAGQPWFEAARAEFDDYRPLFAESVNRVRGGYAAASGRPGSGSAEHFATFLFPAGVARAAESDACPEAGQDADPGAAEYYRFLGVLSEEAETAGGGSINGPAVEQALGRIGRDKGFSDEDRIWANTLSAMTGNEAMPDYGTETGAGGGLAASRTGVKDGRTDAFISYLPCASAAATCAALLIWTIRIKKRR